MRVLPRTQFGNPALRKKAKRVPLKEIKSKKFQELVKQMFYTMRRADGVGLAAPQIDKSIQLVVVCIAPTKYRPNLKPPLKTAVINPKIVKHSKETVDDWEGCLSCMAIRGRVPRYTNVTVEYYDGLGEKQRATFKDFHARVFQHEIDHLSGVLYIDRVKDTTSIMTLQEFEKRILGTI